MTNQNLLYIMSFLFLLVKSRQRFNPEDPLTLELQHGSRRQAVQLPTDTLDRSKKYYVTFTINDHHANSTSKARRANGGRGGNALELGVEGKAAAAKGSRRVSGRCDRQPFTCL